jgi:PAP2 superfamily
MQAETTCGTRTRPAPIPPQLARSASTACTANAVGRSAGLVPPNMAPATLTASAAGLAKLGWLIYVRHPGMTFRLASERYPALRYLQIIPVAIALWGLDDAVRFRTDAAIDGLRNAPVVNVISNELGGSFARGWNAWLSLHSVLGTASAWYYIVVQGAVTGIVGIWLIWLRTPSFWLHRNALIACNAIGLVAFWFYPVAPPRMLAGYHDVTGASVPAFSGLIEGKAADQFASLPSLHVTWALWVAVAVSSVLRQPALKLLVWLYPLATILDVLATGNHYWLDVILAPGVLVLAYAIALAPAQARRYGLWPRRRRAIAATYSGSGY